MLERSPAVDHGTGDLNNNDSPDNNSTRAATSGPAALTGGKVEAASSTTAAIESDDADESQSTAAGHWSVSGYGGVSAFDRSMEYRRGTVGGGSLADRDLDNIDLSTLPFSYLESYPYPAFVLLIPLPSAEVDAAGGHFPANKPWSPEGNVFTGGQPFTPVWANSSWDALSHGRSLLDMLSITDFRTFGSWLSDATVASSNDSPASSSQDENGGNSSEEPSGQSGGGPGLGLLGDPTRLSDDDARRSSFSDITFGDLAGDTPLADPASRRNNRQPPWDTTHRPLSVTFTFPTARAAFELTKTKQIVYQREPAGRRLGSHTFSVITTRPRGQVEWFTVDRAWVNTSATCPVATAAPSSDALYGVDPTEGEDLTATATSNHTPPRYQGVSATLDASSFFDDPTKSDLDLYQEVHDHVFQPGNPLFFQRDGTINSLHAGNPGFTPDGRSLDVRVLLETTDWSKTSLGARKDWSSSLIVAVDMLVHYGLAACIWWGDKDYTFLYNQGFASLLGDRHPYVFGQSGAACWADLWGVLGPLTEQVLTGTPLFKEDGFITWKRPSVHELSQGAGNEKYLSQLFIPLRESDGSYGGVLYTFRDHTRGFMTDRRAELVREIGERTSTGRSVADFDHGVLSSLEGCPKDVPFALLYHVDRVHQPSETSASRPEAYSRLRQGAQPHHVDLRLAGTVGVPEEHPSAPKQMTLCLAWTAMDIETMLADAFPSHLTPASPDPSIRSSITSVTHTIRPRQVSSPSLDMSREGDDNTPPGMWPFAEALRTRQPVLVDDCKALIQGYPIRIWDELPKSAILIPVTRSADDIPTAVLVLGINLRSDFDKDYEAFIHAIRLQMTSCLAAARASGDDLRRIAELDSLDRAKSILFSNVSHELYSPLTLISGPIEDVIAESKDAHQRESLIMARRNVQKLSRLVSMLMDVGSLEAGRLKGNFKLVNLGVVTHGAAALFQKSAKNAGLEYIIQCDQSPREVYIDREMWEKILFTTIGNALRYTPSGSIKVSLTYTSTKAVFAVQDTGVGMTEPELTALLEDVADMGNTFSMRDGTSIALFFTKKLIQLQRGTLEIESQAEQMGYAGHGSTFRITLPLGRSHLLDVDVESPMSSAGQMSEEVRKWHMEWEGIHDSNGSEYSMPSSDRNPNSSMSSRGWNMGRDGNHDSYGSEISAPSSDRHASSANSSVGRWGVETSTLFFSKEDVIMLIDDVADTRRYMRSIFEPFCTVVEARDGLEALELFAQHSPNLIISDVMLPRLNGFGLLSALRSGTLDERLVPFIMLTSADNARPGGALSADDYMSRPFNARELIARAHMQLQLGKKRKALEAMFEERTAELRVLTDNSAVGIFRTTIDGRIAYANAAWYNLSGYPAGQEVINWGDYVMESDQARVRQVWEGFVTDRNAGEMTTEWQWANGRWVSTTLSQPSGLSASSKVGFIGCAVDITERKLNEELQRQRIEEAEQRRREAEEAKQQQELLIDITS